MAMTPEQLAMIQMGLGMMAGSSSGQGLGAIVGNAGLGAMNSYQALVQQQLNNKMAEKQMDFQERQLGINQQLADINANRAETEHVKFMNELEKDQALRDRAEAIYDIYDKRYGYRELSPDPNSPNFPGFPVAPGLAQVPSRRHSTLLGLLQSSRSPEESFGYIKEYDPAFPPQFTMTEGAGLGMNQQIRRDAEGNIVATGAPYSARSYVLKDTNPIDLTITKNKAYKELVSDYTAEAGDLLKVKEMTERGIQLASNPTPRMPQIKNIVVELSAALADTGVKALAAQEMYRYSSMGSLIDNIKNKVSDVFTGIPTEDQFRTAVDFFNLVRNQTVIPELTNIQKRYKSRFDRDYPWAPEETFYDLLRGTTPKAPQGLAQPPTPEARALDIPEDIAITLDRLRSMDEVEREKVIANMTDSERKQYLRYYRDLQNVEERNKP